ncbi:MAG TPA: tetratricopeptide repeat protein [Candidatus Sulfotelmatobacter sp.]|jgi:tetratricopeptide (TPR) repeat protein|nr:tetratricopeptide repeat protein [Candidatus Sulfotelmatobacter sp.]
MAQSAVPAGSAPHPATAASPERDPLVDAAFDHFYNLEYDRSIQEFERALERGPNDPAAVNHLLTTILLRELYRMGAMNSGEYANDSFIGDAHRTADPKVKERIKQLVGRAESLEEQELKANPDNVNALYARGVTRAQFALYTALVERAWFSALRNAVGARHDHERVLELDPHYVDAKLVVGTHNYVMGSLPWSVKVAVALVGLSGTKEKGLEYLREVADSNGENSVDARVVLSLFLRREHRYDEARTLMHDLAVRYPRNYLFPLEEANLQRASGHAEEAAAAYRRVWENGREGKYGNLHYELAAWGLGELLRSQKDYAGAAAAYEMVEEAPDPDPETLQKANLAAGEMYDLLQKRDLAMKKYQTVLAENGSTPPAEKAREHIREAYRE